MHLSIFTVIFGITVFVEIYAHTELNDDYAIVHTYPAGYVNGISKRNCTSDNAIIDKLLNGTGYSKFRVPSDTGVDVSVEFWMETVNTIDELSNDFEMDLYINERVRVKGPCFMDLSNFPMDVQTCNLIYESFIYNSQEVRMRWNPAAENPVAVTGRILLPDYNLIGIKNFIKAMPYPAG
uniref:Neurotransmitter-gated ion-channel ligand-binding domain-containing protein n=1 Tax=Panagrolaimus superbus TaxID=310955 RepID=A0A914ZBL7_9BILA